MRKYINWASLVFISCFIYSILTYYKILGLPYLPIDKWDVLPSLAVIAAAIYGIDYINSRKFIELVDSGNIKYLPTVMSAIEKYDKRIYKILMEEYERHITSKYRELNAYIEGERYLYLDDLENGKDCSFDVKKEVSERNSCKRTKEKISEIKKGHTSWEKINEEFINAVCMNYTIKYLLGEIDNNEKQIIEEKVNKINTLRSGGTKVINNINL